MQRRHPRAYEPDVIWSVLFNVERRNMRWLAERTGWSLNTLRQYSAGQRRPSQGFCVAAAKAMGMPIKELFRDIKPYSSRGAKPKFMRTPHD